MLLKPTAAVPHQGGRLIAPDDALLPHAAPLDRRGREARPDRPARDEDRCFSQRPGDRARSATQQQMRVVATYAERRRRDVTREAFIESGNTEVATADRQGVLTAVRRGEAPVLARYEGAYAATTLTVMGDRSGFVWQAAGDLGQDRRTVAAKWQRMKILPFGPVRATPNSCAASISI